MNELNPSPAVESSKGPPIGKLIVALFVLMGVAAGVLRVIDRNRAYENAVKTAAPQSAADLPVLATVPDFALTDQDGRPVSVASLRGKVWVADVFYTYCRGICVDMSREMSKLHGEYAGRAEPLFVSVTSDPGRDKPSVLKDYSELYKADTSRWMFLTGDLDTIHNVVTKGFLLSNKKGEPEGHSWRFVLIDRDGKLRGVYDSKEKDRLMELRRDISFLLKATKS